MYKNLGSPTRISGRMSNVTSQLRLNQQAQHLSIMPSTNQNSSSLKILMLHGYTQSGPLFHAKTKAMEKFLQKVFPNISLSYPTGPLRLEPSDVPGLNMSALQSDSSERSEFYAWWKRSDTSEPPEYVGLDKALDVVADILKSEGPFDGVMGFSQGACFAAIVTSLLEGESRKKAFQAAKSKSSDAISFPDSFINLNHPPLKFCISYCGFVAPGARYAGLYNEPNVQTPMCHVNGSLDSVVEESRTEALIACAGGRSKTSVIVHPGGHFVPSGKQYLEQVAAFIKSTTAPVQEQKVKDEKAEEMDLPF